MAAQADPGWQAAWPHPEAGRNLQGWSLVILVLMTTNWPGIRLGTKLTLPLSGWQGAGVA